MQSSTIVKQEGTMGKQLRSDTLLALLGHKREIDFFKTMMMRSIAIGDNDGIKQNTRTYFEHCFPWEAFAERREIKSLEAAYMEIFGKPEGTVYEREMKIKEEEENTKKKL